MQQDVQVTEVRRVAECAGQGVAVHLRHLDIGNHHVDLPRSALQVEQDIDGLFGTACRMAFEAEIAQSNDRLLQGNLTVVDDQNPRLAQQFSILFGQLGRLHDDLRRGDAVDHFFDVQHLHQHAVHLSDAGDERFAARPVGRRTDIGGQAMHNLADSLNVQALFRAAHIRDDQAATIRIGQRTLADRTAQIDNR